MGPGPCRAVRGEHGEPDYWQGYYIDITEQKQAEEALRQALERERQVLERERQAASELRALDEMKNTFLDAVSHELRTPLATVIGIALTLQRAGPSLTEEDTVDLVDRLGANAGKLDRLLADLLDLDRLTKGIVAPQRSPTDLAALVSRVAQEWRQRSGRQVEVVVEPVVAWVDSAKIERVVENLLANAARHTTADTSVWIKVARRSEGVLLAVEDAGGGVPQELRASCSSPSAKDPERPPTRQGSASASPWWPASPSSTAGGRGCRTGPAAARRSKSCCQTRRPRSCQRPGRACLVPAARLTRFWGPCHQARRWKPWAGQPVGVPSPSRLAVMRCRTSTVARYSSRVTSSTSRRRVTSTCSASLARVTAPAAVSA